MAASFMHPHEFLLYDCVVLRCFSPSLSITSASSDHSSSHSVVTSIHSSFSALSPSSSSPASHLFTFFHSAVSPPAYCLHLPPHLHAALLSSSASSMSPSIPYSLTHPTPASSPFFSCPCSSRCPSPSVRLHPSICLPLHPLSSSHLSTPSPYFCLLFSCEQLSLRGRVRAPSHSLFFFAFFFLFVFFFFFLFNLFHRAISLSGPVLSDCLCWNQRS